MITKLQLSLLKNDFRMSSGVNYFLESKNNALKALKRNRKFSEKEKKKIIIEGQSSDLSVAEVCSKYEISMYSFDRWTNEFLKVNKGYKKDESLLNEKDSDYKFRCVLEGRSGEKSVAEICRREKITQDTFLKWCNDFLYLENRESLLYRLNNPVYKKNRGILLSSLNVSVVKYFENYIDFSSQGLFVESKNETTPDHEQIDVNSFVSLKKLNDIRYINKYIESVNLRINDDAVFAGCFETFSARKKRILVNKIPLVNNIYFALEFIVKRILPKVSLTKKLYFNITKGNDRLLSKAEGLGRLVSCGFSIIDYRSIDGLLYFVVKKIKKPSFNMNASYGPIYKMPRIGEKGKMIGVYKFRTMHPYSEYLQDYMIKSNGYASSGKPANDFRIPVWGKFMRKFWLDELPQLLNVVKGEMKLVGIRPVSERYFQDIPKEMQKLRLSQKPGCIPPYVSLDRSGDVMSVLQAEKDYLEEKIESPFSTDCKYFFSAIFNIIINRKRSA